MIVVFQLTTALIQNDAVELELPDLQRSSSAMFLSLVVVMGMLQEQPILCFIFYTLSLKNIH